RPHTTQRPWQGCGRSGPVTGQRSRPCATARAASSRCPPPTAPASPPISWSDPSPLRQQAARGREDPPQHRPRELAGERVLLARVIRGDQRNAVAEGRHGAVREARGARRRGRAEAAPCAQVRLPTDPPEPHDDAHAVQEPELLEEVWLAARELLRRWLVGGRRAAERGGDVRAAEPEAVV